MTPVERYELSDDRAGLKAIIGPNEHYHIHSDEMSVLEEWIFNLLRPPSKGFSLRIRPAIPPTHRHKIEDTLTGLGYAVSGGGTTTDMTACDITFS